MKILYDGRVWQFQKAGGINRYFAEIIMGLPPDWAPIITGATDLGQNAPNHPNLSVLNPPRLRPGRLQPHFNRILWGRRIVRDVNLLHPTYYDLTSDFQLSDFKCPVVITVHDLISARFPHMTDWAVRDIHSQRESVLRADSIVCVSKSTERDLLEFIPEATGKTTVIYHGSSFAAEPQTDEGSLIDKPTFLFVGGRGGYKNFLFLLGAFAKAASVVPQIRLNVVGAPFNSEERWRMHFLGITDKVFSTTYPEEAALPQFYRDSVALLYPSRYEGFGIPPLEAMSCGTIPITGNTTSLPEVVGDGGIMLDPADENAWTDCIIKLARPFPERARLLESGRQRVQQFTWAECVRQHLTIYKELSR